MALLAACLWAFFPLAKAADESLPEVKIGLLAYRGAERAQAEWEAAIAYLNAALPQYRFLSVPRDIPALTRAVADEQVDFIVTNPGHYVEMEVSYGAARLASARRANIADVAEATGVVVFTRADRGDIAHWRDLRGRTVAAATPDSFGFRIALRELSQDDGVSEGDINWRFVGFPIDAIVDAVRADKAEAGIIRNCTLEQLAAEGRIVSSDFRIVAAQSPGTTGCATSSRLYPAWPFARLARTSEPLARQVTQALLAMPPTQQGLTWTVPVAYQSVHELYRSFRIGPYEGLQHRSTLDLLWQYRMPLAMIALAIVLSFVHVIRTRQLLLRRTAELRQAHEEAQQRRREMEHAARLSLMGEMAASLAHELNQPLVAIVNYARGCQRRMAREIDLAAFDHGISQIASQAERAAAIVKQMRHFVRKQTPDLAELSLADVIDETLEFFQPVVHRERIALAWNRPEALPPIRGNKVQLQEVFLNLLQNAADAIRSQAERRLRIDIRREGDMLVTAITDNGPGLTPEAEARLFEAFFTTKSNGLGLGLSLSRGIVEHHGGRLSGASSPAGGAVFNVSLPIAGV